MSRFTEILAIKVVKIKDWRATNLNVMHSVLKGKFFFKKIYLSIFKFLKEKKVDWFFLY